MRFALIGQPNCGKSTLFNQVAGYKAETGNFSGTTVTFTESKVRVGGTVVELVDLPGTYTLTGTNPAERVTLVYLASHPLDVIVNIIDATHLAQGLGLTIELLELGIPTVVGLNMMDEAARLGLVIDGLLLQDKLGIPVLPLIASKGRGVRPLFGSALNAANRPGPKRLNYSPDLEKAIQNIAASLDGGLGNLTPEAAAIRVLEMDELAPELADQFPRFPSVLASRSLQAASDALRNSRGQEPAWVVSADRYGLAAQLARQVIRQGPRRVSWRDRLDDFLLHPVAGYAFLVVALFLLFQTIYSLGSALEGPLLQVFALLEQRLVAALGAGRLHTELVIGMVQGVSGGVAIVLPYLLPFLLGLGFLEDMGYLPRVAFLMDALMHRLGLHGKAVVPFILGYGCNVPAVMSTRMLEERRDRFLAAALATLVPCAARLAVVFGLVAFYMGPLVALLIYMFNLFVIALTGRVISGLLPEDTPGLILEMPVYRIPTLRNVLQKAWFRAREFIVEAWPILILGSLVLALLNYFNFAQLFNLLIRPVTWGLGLPSEVGVPLIFGVLRKELSLIMLRQALRVEDISSALNNVQMITFTVFVVFYVPCLATLAVLRRELGTRDMFLIGGLTVVIASLAALAARLVAMLYYL